MNLKRETETILNEHDKGVDDIVWMGEVGKYRVSNRHMLNYLDVEYYNDFGGHEIPLDLVVVGDAWWLERREYDGSEWWEFKTIPQPPKAIVRDGKIL